MTTLHVSPPAKGRRVKVTPKVIESIRNLVAQGVNRHEIANRLGVTVGSLQVTCSRLGISLRINGLQRHTADRTPCSVGIAHAREQMSPSAARTAPVAHFAITMRLHGIEKTTHIPLPSPAIEFLALEATSRNLDIAALIGQVLVGAINKDMIDKILR